MSARPRIGALYVPRPSMFSRRDAAGSFSHVMPPMTAVDECLQQALLTQARPAAPHQGDRWVALVAYAGVIGLAVARVLAALLS